MNAKPLKSMLLSKLQEKNYEGVKGSRLSLHIPVQESLLNSVIDTVIKGGEGMNDFESVVLSDLNENEFVALIKHKKINKTIRCLLHEIHYNKYSEPVIVVEFLDGINFYEKFALKSATAFKKGLNWFKSKFQDEQEEKVKSKSAVNLSSSSLSLNLAELLRQQNLDYLNLLITWKEFSTSNNKLIIDLIIKI